MAAKKGDLATKGKEEQWKLLGSVLAPKVGATISQKQFTNKITGMIIDLSQFSLDEILAMMGNEQQLRKRILEAEELLASAEKQ